MINQDNRYKPNQKYTIQKFNDKVNRFKSANRILTRRGGVKL